MISTPKDRITTPQSAVILINYVLGTGILTLPRTAAQAVKTPDVWISVIIGGLLAMLAGIIMAKLSERYPEKTFYQYSRDIIGKWCGGFISLLIICYFFMASAFQVRSMTAVTDFFLLEGTPSSAIILCFMWVSLFVTVGGINPIARLFEIIFPITIIIFIVIASLSLRIFEVDHLRPVLGLGIMPVLKGVKATTLAFAGPEIMLLLLAFMKHPNKGVKVVVVGIGVTIVFYLVTIILVIGALSIEGVQAITWPTIDLMRSFEIEGLLFERFESLLLTIWIMQMFASYTITFYGAALGLAQLFNKNIHPFLYGLLPIIFIVSMIPKNVNDLFKFGDFIGNSAIYLFGGLPLLFLIISGLKERKA
ncbi:GerAB/ArcD/ProY family transporter [Cohnella luojiensis]|uniref:Spore gernimation protein n=1 Tax=Cohnella luojiensis TaxID=652876 RepID=A0A4Y8M7G6_9BACL|nr:GerAB/ArcD/ProY family transporter [Cohnella luojiensis]TFE30669.1 spore gernimation protein [Cohnella luojiensis]